MTLSAIRFSQRTQNQKIHKLRCKHGADSPEDSGYCQLPSIPRDKCTLKQKNRTVFVAQYGSDVFCSGNTNKTPPFFGGVFVWHEVRGETRVQAASNSFVSALLVQLDAELARRGSESSCPCQTKHHRFSVVFLFGTRFEARHAFKLQAALSFLLSWCSLMNSPQASSGFRILLPLPSL